MTYLRKILLAITLLVLLFPAAAQKGDIDRVIAIVGGQPILLSDLEAQYIQYLMQQGTYFEDQDIRCSLFEELLIQKLMHNQALLDSVEVTDKQVNQRIDNKMNYYILQMGSKEQFEEYYGKTVEEFKAEFFSITRDQIMIEQVQQGITGKVQVTPTQVKRFFKEIPKDSLPTIPAEYEIGQIVKIPPQRPEAREKAVKDLEALRDRIIDGEDFAVLAKLYSKDPGTASKGGEISFSRGMMDPNFEAAAFALKNPGDMSPVVESAFGFHIIRLIKRSGEFITARHILIIPEIGPKDLLAAEKDLYNIKALIEMDSITFENATLRYSDDPSGKNGGRLVNPETGASLFSKKELDPAVAHTTDKMKQGELSKPVIFITDDGKQAYRLLYLYRKVDAHTIDLNKDYDRIRSFALQKEKMDIMNQWIERKIKETYIKILDDTLKTCTYSYPWEG